MCMITYTQLMYSFASVSYVFRRVLDNDKIFDRMLASMKPSQIFDLSWRVKLVKAKP